jgi:hypothetical protein
MQKLEYNFPSKVKKFNIVNPILKFFVAKYENKIPWQSVVKSETELDSYIKNYLYTELIKNATIGSGDTHVPVLTIEISC